jgi:hypothetical protein
VLLLELLDDVMVMLVQLVCGFVHICVEVSLESGQFGNGFISCTCFVFEYLLQTIDHVTAITTQVTHVVIRMGSK